MENLLQDARYGIRMLLRAPAVSALAVLALALGIGANSAIFSVVYAVLLRPLPVRDAARLTAIRSYNDKMNIPPINPGFASYSAWAKEAASFESMAAAWAGAAELEFGREPQRAQLWRVSASFFQTVGVQPVVGRSFTGAEDRPGGGAVALLGYDLWRERFAGQSIAGKTVAIDGKPHVILGVMPRGFHIDGKPADVYTPIALDPDGKTWLDVVVYARLKPGVALAQAQSEMDVIAKRRDRGPGGWKAQVTPLREAMTRDVRLSLLVLLGAVAMVLLIACANIASLLLARSSARRREIAVRAALGAGRRRLLAQFLTESVLLAACGGAAGLLLAAWCVRLTPLLENARLPSLLLSTRIDGAVLAFTSLVSLATGIAFGIGPALSGVSADLNDALRSGVRAGESPGRKRLWSALVIAETALALTLMIGATLLIRSFFYLRDTAPGFRVDGLAAASVSLPRDRYASSAQVLGFYEQGMEKLRGIPGVQSVALASSLPLDGDYRAMSLRLEGHEDMRPRDWPVLWWRAVDKDYFRTLQIPLRRGRFFTDQDREGAPKVALINETMATRFWPGRNPIGKHLGGGKELFEIVGVVGDIRHQDAMKQGLTEVFFPYLQMPARIMSFAVRVNSGDPRRLGPAMERALAAVDPSLPPPRVQDVLRMASDRLAAKRLTTAVISVFAGLALVLAAIGIYGVLSFTVAQRTHEIGVRMALGAERSAVVRMVVGRATSLAAVGIAIGIAASLGCGRVIRSLLFGVTATDPRVFAGVAAALLGVAAAAAWLPARRAARVDPAIALREE
jgi:putative ABC transport system permease protein